MTELEASARYGCSLCRMIYEQLRRNQIGRIKGHIRFVGNFEKQWLCADFCLSPGNYVQSGHLFAGNPLEDIQALFESNTCSTLMTESEPSFVAVVTRYEVGRVWIDRCFKWKLLSNEHIVF